MLSKTYGCCVVVLASLFFSLTGFSQCEDFELNGVLVIGPLCNGDLTGSITVETTGGTGSNDYSILPEEFSIGTDGIASDLSAGDYTIGVIDEAGCELEFDVTVFEPTPMEFTEWGSLPSYCRVFDYQNGGGVVFGAATGGTGDYDYVWKNLETEESIENSTTWGGLEPGEYQMTATDDNGCELIGVNSLDSINPQANFDIISDDVWDIPYGYAGNAPVNIVCKNTSEGVYNIYDPSGSELYHWHMHNYADWVTTDDYNFEPTITYNFENLWGIKLVAKNGNGCLDTAHQFIAVFGPVSLEEPEEVHTVSIVPNDLNGNIKIQKSGFSNGVLVRLYNNSGVLLFEKTVRDNEESFPFNMTKGIYFYEFINSESSERIGSGKFVY